MHKMLTNICNSTQLFWQGSREYQKIHQLLSYWKKKRDTLPKEMIFQRLEWKKRIRKEHKTEFQPRWWLFLGCNCQLYRPKQITRRRYVAGRASGNQISGRVCWFSSIIRSWPGFQVHPSLLINFPISTVTILTHVLSCFLSILASVIPVLSFKPSSKSHHYFKTEEFSFQTILITLHCSFALPNNYSLCSIDINNMDEESVFARVHCHVQQISRVLALIPKLE